ncbi:MAG: hypothetical protein PUP93_21340 [Rhizonema sp. NSF051]|nr:hypothetical protein [Rhizonema sp. NSF051]
MTIQSIIKEGGIVPNVDIDRAMKLILKSCLWDGTKKKVANFYLRLCNEKHFAVYSQKCEHIKEKVCQQH